MNFLKYRLLNRSRGAKVAAPVMLASLVTLRSYSFRASVQDKKSAQRKRLQLSKISIPRPTEYKDRFPFRHKLGCNLRFGKWFALIPISAQSSVKLNKDVFLKVS